MGKEEPFQGCSTAATSASYYSAATASTSATTCSRPRRGTSAKQLVRHDTGRHRQLPDVRRPDAPSASTTFDPCTPSATTCRRA